MDTQAKTRSSEKRPPRARSSLQSEQPPPEASSVGEVYASVRAILDRFEWHHATTAVKAAYDAAAQHVTQSLVTGGGQRDE